MPKVQAVAQSQRSSSHSDGFVGHEAAPIGKFMPVRKQNRRQQIWHKLTVRMGELTLVAERQSDQDIPENQSRPRKKTAKKPGICSERVNDSEQRTSRAPAEGTEEDGDPMLVDEGDQPIAEGGLSLIAQPAPATETAQESHDAYEQLVNDEELLQQPQDKQFMAGREQTTPQISEDENKVLDPPSRSSPLKQKEQRNRKVAFEDETNVQPSESGSTQSRGPFGRREPNEVSVSQQLKMISASKKVAKPQKKEIDVPLQVRILIPFPSYHGPLQGFAMLSHFAPAI